MKTIMGIKRKPINMYMPNFHPLRPKVLINVSVKSMSSPAAVKTIYWVVKLITKDTKQRMIPRANPL